MITTTTIKLTRDIDIMNKDLFVVVLVLSLIFFSEFSFGQTITKRWPVANNYYSVKSNANTYGNFNRNQNPVAQHINWQANYVAANYNPYVMQQQFNTMVSRLSQPKINFSYFPNAASMMRQQFRMPNFNIVPMMMAPPMMAYHYGQSGFANVPFFPSVGVHY